MGSAQSQHLANAEVSAFYKDGMLKTEDQAVVATSRQLAAQMLTVINFEYMKKLWCKPNAYLDFELNRVTAEQVKDMLTSSDSGGFRLDRSTLKQLNRVHRFILRSESDDGRAGDAPGCSKIFSHCLTGKLCMWKVHIDSLSQVRTLLQAADSIDSLDLRSRHCNFGCCIVKTVDETSTVKQMAKMSLIMKAESILAKTIDRKPSGVITSQNLDEINEALKMQQAKLTSQENGLRLYMIECTTRLSNISYGVMPCMKFSGAEESDRYTVNMYRDNQMLINKIVAYAGESLNIITTRRRLKSGEKVMKNIHASKVVKDLFGVQLFVEVSLLSELALNVSRAWSRATHLDSVNFARVKSSFNKETAWLDFKLQVGTSTGLIMEVQIVPVRNFLADMDLDGHSLHDLKITMDR